LKLPVTLLLIAVTLKAASTGRRKVIINEDCSGPGGSNMQTVLLLLQSPQVDVLGITIVSGDQWRDEEVTHTLRLLEIAGRTDVPVMLGAAHPLVNTREQAEIWQQRYGKLAYSGAWDPRWYHEASIVPPMPEGTPSLKASDEDAIHFLLRKVREFPNQVTIYEGGPMTNLALAISIDPQFPQLAEQLVFMGGSLNPHSDNPEWINAPRHEFNFWFDPEAAFIVLRAPWKKIVCTPVDISIKAQLKPEQVKTIEASGTPIARYIGKYYLPGDSNDLMWDELAAAAWIDPSLITKKETRFMSVDIDHGAGYGNTLTWHTADKPNLTFQPVEINVDLDYGKFIDMFSSLMSRPSGSPR